MAEKQWTGIPGVACPKCKKSVVSHRRYGDLQGDYAEFACEICGFRWTLFDKDLPFEVGN